MRNRVGGATAARWALVACFLAVAAASVGRTFGETWSFMRMQRSSYAELTRDEPNVVPGFQALLPVPVTSFFASHLHRDERFYVQVPEGSFSIAGVDYPTAVRTFARFELLPAIAVTDPGQADVVLSVGSDPRALGLRYERIYRTDDGRYTVARVR